MEVKVCKGAQGICVGLKVWLLGRQVWRKWKGENLSVAVPYCPSLGEFLDLQPPVCVVG